MKTHWSIRVTTNREARVDRLIRALRVSGVTHLFDVLLYEKEQELRCENGNVTKSQTPAEERLAEELVNALRDILADN